MVNFIGPAEVSAIQEIDFSDGLSSEEIDLVDEDSNILFLAEDEATSLSFSGSLIEGLSVQDESLEEMRKEVKSLSSEDVEFVPVVFNGKRGFFSAENIDVSEESSSPTIRNVDFSGLFLPWPKHFPHVDFEARRKNVLPDIPTFFSIVSLSTNSPIVEGEELSVGVDIKNEGIAGTGEVTLSDFDFNVVDSEELSLDSFSSSRFSLFWQTEEGDFGEGEVQVSTSDDTESIGVLIEELIDNFDVEIVSSNSPIKESEELIVSVDVENTGTQLAAQDILLRNFNLDVVDTESLTLSVGEQQNLNLSWQTEEGDAGSDVITVESDDDSDSQEVTIEELLEGFFSVNIQDTNSPIEETETLEVDVLLENTGERDSTKEVRLFDIRNNLVDVNNVQLNSDESKNIVMGWQTDLGDEGTGEITVETDDDSDAEEVTIEIGGF